jgi:hypothetical protein
VPIAAQAAHAFQRIVAALVVAPPAPRARRSYATLLLASALAASCHTPRSQILVVVELDPVDPPVERVDSVAVTVRSASQPDPPRFDQLFTIGTAAGQTALPFSFGVYPIDEAVERRVDITVGACGTQGCIGRAGGTRDPLVTVRANVGFVREETRVLTLRLSQRCVGVMCGAAQSCDPELGRCTDDTVDANTLPRDARADGGADVVTRPQVVQVAAGGGYTCFRMTDATVRCAGGALSLLEYSTFPSATASSTPTIVPGLDGAIDVAVGMGHACAIMPDHTARCWGANRYGQLGDGTTQDRVVPVGVSDLHDVAQIALGGFFSCARLLDGTVTCWGLDASGELGDAMQSAAHSQPQPVPGVVDAVEIAAGGLHACARLASGTVSCWGARFAALGDGLAGSATLPPTTPVTVLDLTDATQLTAGEFTTCARRATGAVACWGSTAVGQTGTGVGRALTPTAVIGVDAAVEVRAGAYHACARLADGRVACWGRNDRGQVGSGDRERDRARGRHRAHVRSARGPLRRVLGR